MTPTQDEIKGGILDGLIAVIVVGAIISTVLSFAGCEQKPITVGPRLAHSWEAQR